MNKFVEMRFCAVEGVDVPDPFAPPSGQRRVIGKTFSPETGEMHCNAEPALVRMAAPDFHAAKVLLRKCVAKGELVCADAATAAALGLPDARLASASHADQEPV
jgi:hypothetical protein